MRQAIGDRAGEAATLYAIGVVGWRNGRREVGIRLAAMATGLLAAIGAAEQRQVMQNLETMAGQLGLDRKGYEEAVREGGDQYQRDRGAALVQAAFEGL